MHAEPQDRLRIAWTSVPPKPLAAIEAQRVIMAPRPIGMVEGSAFRFGLDT